MPGAFIRCFMGNVFTDEKQLVENLKYDTPMGKSDRVCLTWDYVVKVKEEKSCHPIICLTIGSATTDR